MALTRPRQRYIDAYSKRKAHYLRKHVYADRFRAHGLHDVARQLTDCQETEVLACCSHCGKSWYIINRCRLRVCPLCSYEVSKRRANQLIALTHQMKFPKLITLTMPTWTGEPREGIKYLRTAWNTLRKHKLFKTVRGGAYQIELKPKARGWHIHLHALVDCPFMPHQKLYSTWTAILGIPTSRIDIRAAKTTEQRAYAAKYAAKAADFYSDPDTVVLWYKATKGQRLFATFGHWYNVNLEELPHDGKLEKFVSTCPHCKSTGTVFLARDGPFFYGGKEWTKLSKYFMNDLPTEEVITEIRDDIHASRTAIAETKKLTAYQQEFEQ